jgi:hypothetical protein
MKAGRVSDDILYVMGVAPGDTTGVAIIGGHQSTIYRDRPGKIVYFEVFSITGNFTSQAIELATATREFYPIVLAVESFSPSKPITSEKGLSPMRVAERLLFCCETHFIHSQFFWQSASVAMKAATDEDLRISGLYTNGPSQEIEATRQAIAFIRRAKEQEELRVKAWGTEQLRFGRVMKASSRPVDRPVRRGSARRVSRLDLTDGPVRTKAENVYLERNPIRRGVPCPAR